MQIALSVGFLIIYLCIHMRLTIYSTQDNGTLVKKKERKKNDALNTYYLQLYCKGPLRQ